MTKNVATVNIRLDYSDRIQQGDVYRNIELIERYEEKFDSIFLDKVRFPFVIVLTQDCDLEEDNRIRCGGNQQDKLLLSVLVAPLYNEEHVFQGSHLSGIELSANAISKKDTEGRYLLQNQRLRYHYIGFPDTIDIPNSIIDFKHYFSVPINQLLHAIDSKGYVCTIDTLFREQISIRFANFLSRIGLPPIPTE